MKQPIQIPALIDSLRTLKDGSVKITIETQELRAEDAAILFSYRNTMGWMLFKETEFSREDIISVPDVVPEFASDKTPSKRLRAVLFVTWEQSGKVGDFDTFYKSKMERIIQQFKEHLQ